MAALDMPKSSQISLLYLSPIDAAPKCSQMLAMQKPKYVVEMLILRWMCGVTRKDRQSGND